MYSVSEDWLKKSFVKLNIIKIKMFRESITINDKLIDDKAPYNIGVLDNIAKENSNMGK